MEREDGAFLQVMESLQNFRQASKAFSSLAETYLQNNRMREEETTRGVSVRKALPRLSWAFSTMIKWAANGTEQTDCFFSDKEDIAEKSAALADFITKQAEAFVAKMQPILERDPSREVPEYTKCLLFCYSVALYAVAMTTRSQISVFTRSFNQNHPGIGKAGPSQMVVELDIFLRKQRHILDKQLSTLTFDTEDIKLENGIHNVNMDAMLEKNERIPNTSTNMDIYDASLLTQFQTILDEQIKQRENNPQHRFNKNPGTSHRIGKFFPPVSETIWSEILNAQKAITFFSQMNSPLENNKVFPSFDKDLSFKTLLELAAMYLIVRSSTLITMQRLKNERAASFSHRAMFACGLGLPVETVLSTEECAALNILHKSHSHYEAACHQLLSNQNDFLLISGFRGLTDLFLRYDNAKYKAGNIPMIDAECYSTPMLIQRPGQEVVCRWDGLRNKALDQRRQGLIRSKVRSISAALQLIPDWKELSGEKKMGDIKLLLENETYCNQLKVGLLQQHSDYYKTIHADLNKLVALIALPDILAGSSNLPDDIYGDSRIQAVLILQTPSRITALIKEVAKDACHARQAMQTLGYLSMDTQFYSNYSM